ncbi:acyl-CoA reductase-like NAD-dependent aldehyde dehydrogenase [Kribbella steppae]|uniref:Acyl-CoA reductase-like NAD-dependent aldehyde dehydrogenase n=1 Tax=Kribbella steppae TaxID=2512223 RepID=A0A4R2HHV7_9ACTN|nr:aldehyde dehydrogenase family protein [Kribbella steppae]TCO28038.1 acyl-CoA reductase-like NAD-dependent aldehyde dehydrogenase [Kribbella steppae]
MGSVTPFYASGAQTFGLESFDVRSPRHGELVATVSVPTAEQVEQAVTDLDSVRGELQRTSAGERASVLDHVSRELGRRRDEVAHLIALENGKPRQWALAEVDRGASTFRWAAEEARRFSGEVQRLDTEPGGNGRIALVRRFPRGPVLAITPFNFPLNLVAHKLAPAIAVGAPVLVKPAPATPLTALLLAEIIAETDWPARALSVLTVPNERMPELVADPRLPVVSFTGSGPVGWSIRDRTPRKHVSLELGGNAAVVVDRDWADLDTAARRIALFATYQAGQSCISVQRVIVHRDVAEAFIPALQAAVREIASRTMDPERDVVGPVINDAAAERIESWVAEAVAEGADLLVGGPRRGRLVQPTLLRDVPRHTALGSEEVFGPVLTVTTASSVEDAFSQVNDSRYGLQVGVFTQSMETAFTAHRELEVGGVVIGDVPSYRADQTPYGGWKESGVGREGVAAAMEDLTEPRVMILTGMPL